MPQIKKVTRPRRIQAQVLFFADGLAPFHREGRKHPRFKGGGGLEPNENRTKGTKRGDTDRLSLDDAPEVAVAVRNMRRLR